MDITKRNLDKDSKNFGLIEGLEYPKKDSGLIDWEKLINPKYLIYPNNDPTRDPMVRVDGLRDLAEIRGIAHKEIELIPVSDRFIICRVKMLFMPNCENPDGRIWESTADATPENINGRMFGRFLTACAETRAVGRCIKEALGIRMLVQEEVSDLPDEDMNLPVSDEVIAAINRQCKLKGIDSATLMADIQEKYPTIKSLKDLNRDQGGKTLSWLNSKPNAKNS